MSEVRGRIRRGARRVVWRYQGWRLPSSRLLRAFARDFPEATFVQVGSNDGEQLDPLRPHILRRKWRGLMIEPIPHVFERLRSNYGRFSDRVALANVAIADQEGSLPFHHLAEVSDHEAQGLPKWYDALGSFRREVVLKHVEFIPDIEDRMVVTDVPCERFDDLLDRHGIDQLDLLHIDTEGYDFEILKNIDWDRRRPLIVIYEHLHLDEGERSECSAFLRNLGYEAIEENMDTWCVHVGTPDPAAKGVVDLFRSLVARRPSPRR